MSEETGLDAWFLHEKLILNLLAPNDGAELGRRISAAGSHAFAEMQRADLVERALAAYLAARPVASLEIHLLHGTLRTGQLVWLEQEIAFKGLPIALHSIAQGEDARATFSARLASHPSIRVHGDYNPVRLTCSTAKSQLSGTRRQFMLGYIQDITDDVIDIRPITIASRWGQPTPEIDNFDPAEPSHIWPGAVDQFAGVDFSQRMAKSDLNMLKDIPEGGIRKAFVEILGRPDLPKDRGSQQTDLWTTHLLVEGHPLIAAFLFNEPAEFEPMTIASLGKNGDQIDKLSSIAADVLVVQHCHSIPAPVVNMMRVYASDPYHPRRYLVINGYDTIKLLRHFGHIS